MHHSDFSIRSNAIYGIEKLLQRISEAEQSSDFNPYVTIVEHVVLPLIQQVLQAQEISDARTELITLLGKIIKLFPDKPVLSSMTCLLNAENDERDFFLNIVHLQQHRNIQALHLVRDKMLEGLIDSDAIELYVLPMVTCILLNTEPNRDGMLNAAIDGIKECCAHLDWSIYRATLLKLLRLIPKRRDFERVLLKAVVAILEAFHFKVQADTNAPAPTNGVFSALSSVAKSLNASDAETLETYEAAEAVAEPISAPVVKDLKSSISNDDPFRIRTAVTVQIIPELMKHLSKKDGENTTIRTPIALAIIRLLKHFPVAVLHDHLPKLLLKVLIVLRDKQFHVREAAREALVQIAEILGPFYTPFIIREARHVLRHGYQLHVLAFTIFNILNAVHAKFATECCFDDAISDLLSIFMDDTFGEPSEEKDVQAITAKCEESRKCTSYDAIEVLATCVSPFRLPALIEPLQQLITTTLSKKTVDKIATLLSHICTGINHNKAVSLEDHLKYAFGLISDNLQLSEATKISQKPSIDEPLLHSAQLLPPPVTRETLPEVDIHVNAHLLVEFGLHLLQVLFRHNKMEAKNATHMSMLDPFVALLSRCIQSRHTKIQVSTARLLCSLVAFGHRLASFGPGLSTMVSRVFKLVRMSCIMCIV
jgi:U3 small nucleolar RNA-associated protein 20